jgi:predicted secreted protein
MVTDMASGWPVTLAPGQELVARLTADRAAGAHWVLRGGSDGGVVAMQGEPVSETPSDGPAVEVFRLKATKPGKTTLTFDLKKGSDAVKSASYSITVQ